MIPDPVFYPVSGPVFVPDRMTFCPVRYLGRKIEILSGPVRSGIIRYRWQVWCAPSDGYQTDLIPLRMYFTHMNTQIMYAPAIFKNLSTASVQGQIAVT